MQIISYEVARMPNGRYKVIVWGKHDEHIMDWRGCNYRYVVVENQGRKGWFTQELAEGYWLALGEEEQQSQILRAGGMTGTHMPDSELSGPKMVKDLKPAGIKGHF